VGIICVVDGGERRPNGNATSPGRERDNGGEALGVFETNPRGFSEPIIPGETWSYILEPSLKRQSETKFFDKFMDRYSIS
jgi:hypothetical protein